MRRSFLGLTLFLLYNNDLAKNIPRVLVNAYDTTAYSNTPKRKLVTFQHQREDPEFSPIMMGVLSTGAFFEYLLGLKHTP